MKTLTQTKTGNSPSGSAFSANCALRRHCYSVVAAVLLAATMPLTVLGDTNSLQLINLTGAITNFSGTGIRIGQVESGSPTNHIDLGANIVFTTNFGNFASSPSHATEVAGVMVSTATVTRGVAPAANVYSAATIATNASGGLATNVFQTNVVNAAFFLATNQQTRVINFSIRTDLPGFPSIGTNFTSRALDSLVSQTSNTVVVAAGNTGPAMNTITEPASAFNVIAVGAVTNLPNPTGVADFSARGYLSDGRSKPDLLAPGVNIFMPTYTNGAAIPSTVRTNEDGTSFAAPHVAGVVARLLEAGASNSFPNATVAQAQDPRVIKASLLNSATKLPGWTQTMTVGGGITNIVQPLDSDQGAGLINAARAYDQLAAGKQGPTITGHGPVGNTVGVTGWDFGSVSFGLTNIYRVKVAAVGELRLTLDWYRDVGSDPAYTVLGLGNLDLYLWSSPDSLFTNLTLVARSISTNDNLEHLYFTSLPTAFYQFGVYYSNYFVASGPTLGSINYGVAWSLQAIPEPSLFGLCVLGAVVAAWRRRRRSAAA